MQRAERQPCVVVWHDSGECSVSKTWHAEILERRDVAQDGDNAQGTCTDEACYLVRPRIFVSREVWQTYYQEGKQWQKQYA